MRRNGFLIALEDGQNRGGEDDTPVGGFRLRLRYHQFSLDPMYLPLYLQSSCFEVQVLPFQRADLTTAKARGQFQQKQFVAAILPGLNQQSLDFLRRQHLHFSGLCRWQFAPIGGIVANQVFLYCFVQRCVEGGMDAPNGLVGQTFAVEF